MKSLVILINLLSSVSMAEQTCKLLCDEGTKEQKQCVLKRECDPKIRKLQREVDALKARNKELEEQLATKPVVVTTEKVVEVDNSKVNAISLVFASSPTRLDTSSTPSAYTAETKDQTDLGLMYQRDFSRIRGSLGVGTHGLVLVGAGVTF